MKIKGIIWLDDILEKITQKHHVQPQEVKEILTGHSRFRLVEKGHRPRENVYAALGQNDNGRYLIVFFVYKINKCALIISARDMTKSERRLYAAT